MSLVSPLLRAAKAGDATALEKLHAQGVGAHRRAELAAAERAVRRVEREQEKFRRDQKSALAKAERDQKELDRQRDRENREASKGYSRDAVGFYTDSNGNVRPIEGPSGAPMRRWGGKEGVLWDPVTGKPYLQDENGKLLAADPKEHGKTVKKDGSIYRALPGMKWEWLGYDKDNLKPEKGFANELKDKTRALNEAAKQVSGELALADKDLASDRARLRELNGLLKQPKYLSDTPERTALLQEKSSVEGGLKAKVDRQAQLEVEAYRARASVGDWIKQRDNLMADHMSQRSAAAVGPDSFPNTDRRPEIRGWMLTKALAESMLSGLAGDSGGSSAARPTGDLVGTLAAAMVKNDVARLSAVNKVMGAALEQNAWNRGVEQLKAREKADVLKLSAETPIKLPADVAKRIGMEFVPPNWMTAEAIERQTTARLAGQDIVNLPDNWRLEGGKITAERTEVDRLWGVKVPWTERKTTQEIGTLRYNDFGVPFIELSQGGSPSFNSGDYYSGIPEFAGMPQEWRENFGKEFLADGQRILDGQSQPHIATEVKAEATAELGRRADVNIDELAENAWQGRKWDAERLRDTLDAWQQANDAQRAELIAEINPQQAALAPEDRRLNVAELFQTGQLSIQDARVMGKLAYGTDPGLAPMQDSFRAWAAGSDSEEAQSLRAFAASKPQLSLWQVAKDWVVGGTAATATKLGLIGAETMRVDDAAMFAAKTAFMTDYFRENRHRADFDHAAFTAARNEFLGDEKLLPWALNGINAALQNSASSSAALLWGSMKLLADSATGGGVLSPEERALITDQTMLSLDNMKRAVVDRMPSSFGEAVASLFAPAYLFSEGLRDKVWYGEKNAALQKSVDALITDIDRGVLTPERFSQHGRQIEQAARAYAELSGIVRANYEFDISDPRSAMGQALLAYGDTRNPAYAAMVHAGAASSQLEIRVGEAAAAHASNHGMISESDYFGPMHLAWRGGQVAPLTEMGLELVSTLLTVGVGKALTVAAHLTRGAKAGYALNSVNRVLDDVAGLQERMYRAGLVQRPFGRALTGAEDAWNAFATGGKQLVASGTGEFGQEFIQSFGSAGASVSDALADGVVGFIGGMGLSGVHGTVGYGVGQAQLARLHSARNRALEAFVAEYNKHTPQAPITVEQARQAQAYQSAPTVAMLNGRVRELMAEELRLAAAVTQLAGQRASLLANSDRSSAAGKLAAVDERMGEVLGERLTVRSELAAAMLDVVGVRQASLGAVLDINGLGAEREMVDAVLRLVSGTPLSPMQERVLLEAGVYQSPASGVMIVPESVRQAVGELAPWVAKNYLRATEAEQLAAAQRSVEEGAARPAPAPPSPPPLPDVASGSRTNEKAVTERKRPAAPKREAGPDGNAGGAPPAGAAGGTYVFTAAYRPKGGGGLVRVSQRVRAGSAKEAEAKRERWLAGLGRLGEVVESTPATLEGAGSVPSARESAAVDSAVFEAKPTARSVMDMLVAALGRAADQDVLPLLVSKALWEDQTGAILTDEQAAAAKAAGAKLTRQPNPMIYYDGKVWVSLANLAKTLAQVAPERRAEHLRRMWREEVIHHATLQARSAKQLAEDWRRLPDEAKKRVIETYYMSQLANAKGGDWRNVNVNPVEAAAEFWRMYLTSKFDGATTEQTGFAQFVEALAARDAGLAARLREALESIVEWMRNELLGVLDGEARAEFEAAAEAIEAKLAELAGATAPPAPAPRPPPAPEQAAAAGPRPFVPVDDSARWTPQAVEAAVKLAAAAFGYKIVDTGIDIGVVDRWGNNVNLGTQLYDKLVPGNELGRWIDNLANSTVHAEIADRISSPGLHRVWFGHDFATNLSEVVGEFGWTAIPNYVGQLLKDSLTTSGIPLPGVELLVRGDVVSDRFATDWLSVNIGEVFGGGVALLGTWQLARQAKRGSLTKPRVVFATVGIGVKVVAGVLTAQPFLVLSGLADAAILVTNLQDVRAAFKKGAQVAKTKPAAEAVAEAEAEGSGGSAMDAPRPSLQPVVRPTPRSKGGRGGGPLVPVVRRSPRGPEDGAAGGVRVPLPRRRPPGGGGAAVVAAEVPAVRVSLPEFVGNDEALRAATAAELLAGIEAVQAARVVGVSGPDLQRMEAELEQQKAEAIARINAELDRRAEAAERSEAPKQAPKLSSSRKTGVSEDVRDGNRLRRVVKGREDDAEIPGMASDLLQRGLVEEYLGLYWPTEAGLALLEPAEVEAARREREMASLPDRTRVVVPTYKEDSMEDGTIVIVGPPKVDRTAGRKNSDREILYRALAGSGRYFGIRASEIAEVRQVGGQQADAKDGAAPESAEGAAEGGTREGGLADYGGADTEQALGEAMVADLVRLGLTEQNAVALIEGDMTFDEATAGLSDQAVDDADAVMRGGRERLDDIALPVRFNDDAALAAATDAELDDAMGAIEDAKLEGKATAAQRKNFEREKEQLWERVIGEVERREEERLDREFQEDIAAWEVRRQRAREAIASIGMTAAMKDATVDEARTLLAVMDDLMNEAAVQAGVRPISGQVEKNYNVGFSTVTPKERRAHLKAIEGRAGREARNQVERMHKDWLQAYAIWEKKYSAELAQRYADDQDQGRKEEEEKPAPLMTEGRDESVLDGSKTWGELFDEAETDEQRADVQAYQYFATNDLGTEGGPAQFWRSFKTVKEINQALAERLKALRADPNRNVAGQYAYMVALNKALAKRANDELKGVGAQRELVLGAAPAPVFDTSASTSEVKALRLAKGVVSENGYDFYAVGRLVDEFYNADKYKGLPSNGVLVPVPSTTGRNVVPEMLAGRISRDHGQRMFLGQVAVNAAGQESKAKLSIWRKLEDPVVYEVVPEAMEELRREANGAPIILVEDVINTGESVVEFARVLEDAGLRVTNAAALGATSTQRATQRDLERLSEKVAADTGLSVDAVRPLVYDLFDGAYKKFAAEAERRIRSERGGWRFVRNAERATGRSPSNFERSQTGTGEAASGQGRSGRADSGGGGVALGAAAAPSVMEQMDLFGAAVPVEVRDLVTDNLGLASYHANKYQNIPNVPFEDLQQEAFMALMRAAETFDSERGVPFGAYATRVIKNRLNNIFQKSVKQAKKEQLTLDEEMPGREGETAKDQLADAAAGTTEASDLAILEEVLAAVPGRTRQIVQMMAEGRNWREIGQEVGLSHEGARKAAMATLAQMRRELEARGVTRVADLLNVEAREKAAATGGFEMEDEAAMPLLGAAAAIEANRLAGKELALVASEGRVVAKIRQSNGGIPPKGPLREKLSEFYHKWFRGRLDKVDFYAPGMKAALLDSARDKALATAAVNAMMGQIWDAVQKSFGYPKFWAKNRKRLDAFVNELLPAAARLEVAAIDESGAFIWKPFKMRVGTINASEVKGKKIGDKVATKRGQFELGDRVGDTERHVLLRSVSAAEQQQIYDEFWKKYPEAATFLDRWIMPGMESARFVHADGTKTAEFNRYALRDLYNEWPEEFKELYGGVSLDEMPYVDGYTPDVMQARTLTGIIVTLLNEFRSPARKFKAGWARESGNVRNMFDGFSVRAMQAHLEKIRVQDRARLVEAASVRADAIPEDKRQEYVPLDEVFLRLLAAVRLGERLSDSRAASVVRSMGIKDEAKLLEVFGDAFRLYGREMMVHKAVAHELMLGAARQVTNNALTRILNWLLERYNAGLIATGFSLITNWASNELVLKPVRVANRLFYAALQAAAGDGRNAEIAAREAMHILRGAVMDRSIMPGAKARLSQLVTPEIFEDQTSLEAIGVDRTVGVRDQLARLNVGGAFLQAVGYGNVDLRQKTQLAYAAYRAHAEVALKEAVRAGEVKADMTKEQRLEWMKKWLKEQSADFHRDVYMTTVLYLMDYQNVPALLDPAQSNSPWAQVAKRGLAPFAKWPYNMLKQMKRLSVDSALDFVLPGRTKQERRNAAANLMTLGGLVGVGAVLAGFEDEDDPIFGSNWDEEGKLRVAEARTGNRLNLSRVGRVLAAHGLMRDVDLQAEDGGADAKDIYWRYRNYPYLKEALVVGLFVNGEGQRGSEALLDVVDEYITTGIFVKLAGMDSWDKGKRDDYRMAEAIYDVLASPVAPKPWRAFAGRVVDPVVRRNRPLPSMGYEGGALDAIRVNTPGLSKGVPAAGRYKESALAPFSAENWFKGESEKIARSKGLSDEQKARAVEGLRGDLRATDARSASEQLEVMRGAGLPVDAMRSTGGSMRQVASDLDRLRSMGVGPESWRMNDRGRVVMVLPETVPTRPVGLEFLRFFGGANLKMVPPELIKGGRY